MPEPRAFGTVIHIAAEAIGQPGQRRFRLQAMNADGETATLWLEKEQLTALGEAIENVLKDAEFQYRGRPLDDAEDPPVMPLNTDVDIRLAQLSMGIDRDNRLMVLMGADGPEEADDRTAVNMAFDYRRGYELQAQIAQVVAAG